MSASPASPSCVAVKALPRSLYYAWSKEFLEAGKRRLASVACQRGRVIGRAEYSDAAHACWRPLDDKEIVTAGADCSRR